MKILISLFLGVASALNTADAQLSNGHELAAPKTLYYPEEHVALEDLLLLKVNERRTSTTGLPPLVKLEILTLEAREHSEDLAWPMRVSDIASDGYDLKARLDIAMYLLEIEKPWWKFWGYGEQALAITSGYTEESIDQMIDEWMSDPFTFYYLMSPLISVAGAGVYTDSNGTHYWAFTAGFEYEQAGQLELDVLNMMNQERLNVGCNALEFDDCLMAAANYHSHDMTVVKFFNGHSSDGSTPEMRLFERFECADWKDEAILKSYKTTAAGLFGAFMNRSVRVNKVLDCSFKRIGMAKRKSLSNSTYFWTFDFG